MKLIPSLLVLQVAESGGFYLRIPLLVSFTLIHAAAGPWQGHLFRSRLASPRPALGEAVREVSRSKDPSEG